MTRFQIKSFEAEAVVYDLESGDTHYLKPLTFALYQAHRAAPSLSRSEVIENLRLRVGIRANSTFSTLAEDAWDSLQRIGLLNSE